MLKLLATRLDRVDDTNRDLSSRFDIIETSHEELKKWKDDIRTRSWSLVALTITGLIVGFILLLGQYLFGSFQK